MHHLSSKWTIAHLLIFITWILATIAFAILNYPNTTWAVVSAIQVIVLLFYLKGLNILRYNEHSLHVRGAFLNDIIPMSEILRIDTQSSFPRRVYRVELKSGRMIEFVPTTFAVTFIWESQDPPPNVRRFLTILRNYQLQHPS